MAGKKFGALNLVPGKNHLLMTGGNGVDSTVVISFVNRGQAVTRVSMALVSGNDETSLTDADWVIYMEEVSSFNHFVWKGLVVPSNHSVIVSSSNKNVNCIAYGFEAPCNDDI